MTQVHIIALLCSAYLAMVREFGYQIALISSGALMRRQFFLPTTFHPQMPMNSQLTLSSPPPPYSDEAKDIWMNPFKFTVDGSSCLVVYRTNVIRVPISRDPRIPIAQHLVIKPSKYKLRPDFNTVFS